MPGIFALAIIGCAARVFRLGLRAKGIGDHFALVNAAYSALFTSCCLTAARSIPSACFPVIAVEIRSLDRDQFVFSLSVFNIDETPAHDEHVRILRIGDMWRYKRN